MREDGVWNEWFEEIKGESTLDLLLVAAAKKRRKRLVRYGAMGAFAVATIGLICWQMWPWEVVSGSPTLAGGNSQPLPKRMYPLLPKFPESGGTAIPSSEPGPASLDPGTNGLAVKPVGPAEGMVPKVSLEIIDDDQLFDLLKGQSVAIVGEKGQRRVIFLDAVSARNPPPKKQKKWSRGESD